MKPFLSVTLFDRTGATMQGQIANAFDKSFVDELRGSGSFSFTIPKEESGNIAIGKIVKFGYGTQSSDYVFAGVIESIKRTHTDTQDILQISGRGVRSLLEAAVIFTSDRTYSAKSPGYIMKQLIDEAQVRGALSGITYTFTNTQDSNGTAFGANQTLTIDEKIGTNLAEIANRHEELAIDVWVKPDLSVNYYIERGTDTTTTSNPIVLRVGESVVSYETRTEGPIRNAAIVTWGTNNSIKTATRPTSIGANGRSETYLSLSNIPDSTTTDIAITRTLDNLDDPTVGATIEITDDALVPYIDFQIGDWIYVADDTGSRIKYRVRSVAMAEEANGGLRIVPELGNVKADLEERLRRLIARQEAKTASGSADASAASVDLNGVGDLGGGITFDNGTVFSYDPTTGTGTADAFTIDPIDPIDFTNATGTFLAVGDDIVIGTFDHDGDPTTPDVYIAVGITQRAGTIIPTQNPVGVIPPDFPFRSDTYTYPINGGSNNSNVIQVNDMAGLLGFGTDLILGPATSSAGVTNALSRGTTNSVQISGSVGQLRYALLSDGTLITYGATGSPSPAWRNPSTGVWTTMFSTVSSGHRHVFDHSTGIFWSFAHSNTGGPFFKFGPGDTAPVPLGSLGTGIPNTTTTAELTADNGWLILRQGSSSPFPMWRKSSSDTTNFASTGSTTNIINGSWHVGPDGRVHYYTINSGTFWIITYDPSNGSSASVNTGITSTGRGIVNVRAISATVFALFGHELVSTSYYAKVWTFNGTSNALMWTSAFTTSSIGAAAQQSTPVRTAATTWRWSLYADASPARTWQMELTFT